MRRGLRVLAGLATLISTLLCALTLAVWFRSRTTFDQMTTQGNRVWTLRSNEGRLRIERIDDLLGNLIAGRGLFSADVDTSLPYDLVVGMMGWFTNPPTGQWRYLGVQCSWGTNEQWRLTADATSPSFTGLGMHLIAHRFPVLSLTMPHAHAALLTGTPALVWLAARGRRRSRTLRRCRVGARPRCGYDLRATPARCPECGRVARGGGMAAKA